MTSTEISLIPGSPAERWKYAETLADANLLPVSFRRRPADVFYAVEYGAMLGLSPIAALTGIHVIEGKPSASAALMSGLVRKAGHRLRVRIEGRVSDGTLAATAELVRADDPDHTFTATWDLHRAERAGLLILKRGEHGEVIPWSRSEKGKPQSWEKFPEAMCKARAISEVARDGAEECLFGMHYTPEELGAEVDADGDMVSVTVVPAQSPAPTVEQPSSRPGPTVDVVDAEVIDDGAPAPRPQPDRRDTQPQGPAPAPVPDGRPVAAAATEAARLVAQAATRCGDYPKLLRTYESAKQQGLLEVPVESAISPQEAVTAGVGDPPCTLERWLKACGTYARLNGGMSVYDAVVAAAETVTRARDDGNPYDAEGAANNAPTGVDGDPDPSELGDR